MTLTRPAPAKINLTLEILGRRSDGYHNLRSVMQAISLYDVITVEDAPFPRISVAGGSPDAPADERNLVYRAAQALDQSTGGGHGARIALEKRIPVGAGLGGGSSDAAATLLALNHLWGTGLSTESLMEIGSTLGSDVPFFLTGGTALAEGRGERLTPLPPPERLWLVVAWPDFHLSTPAVYARLDDRGIEGQASDRSATLASMLPGGSVETVAAAIWNDMEQAAFDLCPTAGVVRDALLERGALAAMLSGSGSAVFGLAEDEAEAHSLAGKMKALGTWAFACHTVPLPYEGES